MSDTTQPPLARRATRCLTPDEVLAEFRMFCGECFGYSRKSADEFILPVTTVGELKRLHHWDDLKHWSSISDELGLDLPLDWAARWPDTATVADICDDLSQRTEVPVIEPWTILGRKCETAGAFLTLKRMLADDGADVSDLAPSSSLAPFVRTHRRVFNRLRLAYPGRVSSLETTNTPACLGCVFVAVGLLMLVCGLKLPDRWVGVVMPLGLILLAISGVLFLVARLWRSRLEHVLAIGHGAVYDFRGLIHALVGREQRVSAT